MIQTVYRTPPIPATADRKSHCLLVGGCFHGNSAGEGIRRKGLGLSWHSGDGDVWGDWRQKNEVSVIKIHVKPASSDSPVHLQEK